MFQGNNRIRRKGFVRKTSSVASHQTSWYNKRMLRKTFWAPRDSSLIENYKLTSLDKGVATRGAKKAMSSPPTQPHFNFPTKQGPTTLVSNIRDIAFLGVQRSYKPGISLFLLCMLQFLDNLWQFFIFF